MTRSDLIPALRLLAGIFLLGGSASAAEPTVEQLLNATDDIARVRTHY